MSRQQRTYPRFTVVVRALSPHTSRRRTSKDPVRGGQSYFIKATDVAPCASDVNVQNVISASVHMKETSIQDLRLLHFDTTSQYFQGSRAGIDLSYAYEPVVGLSNRRAASHRIVFFAETHYLIIIPFSHTITDKIKSLFVKLGQAKVKGPDSCLRSTFLHSDSRV